MVPAHGSYIRSHLLDCRRTVARRFGRNRVSRSVAIDSAAAIADRPAATGPPTGEFQPHKFGSVIPALSTLRPEISIADLKIETIAEFRRTRPTLERPSSGPGQVSQTIGSSAPANRGRMSGLLSRGTALR
jgi:hypothetical protein